MLGTQFAGPFPNPRFPNTCLPHHPKRLPANHYCPQQTPCRTPHHLTVTTCCHLPPPPTHTGQDHWLPTPTILPPTTHLQPYTYHPATPAAACHWLPFMLHTVQDGSALCHPATCLAFPHLHGISHETDWTWHLPPPACLVKTATWACPYGFLPATMGPSHFLLPAGTCLLMLPYCPKHTDMAATTCRYAVWTFIRWRTARLDALHPMLPAATTASPPFTCRTTHQQPPATCHRRRALPPGGRTDGRAGQRRFATLLAPLVSVRFISGCLTLLNAYLQVWDWRPAHTTYQQQHAYRTMPYGVLLDGTAGRHACLPLRRQWIPTGPPTNGHLPAYHHHAPTTCKFLPTNLPPLYSTMPAHLPVAPITPYLLLWTSWTV